MLTMTCCIAYTNEEKAIGFLSQTQGFWSPHLPCHRIVHVSPYLQVKWLLADWYVGRDSRIMRGDSRTGSCFRSVYSSDAAPRHLRPQWPRP